MEVKALNSNPNLLPRSLAGFLPVSLDIILPQQRSFFNNSQQGLVPDPGQAGVRTYPSERLDYFAVVGFLPINLQGFSEWLLKKVQISGAAGTLFQVTLLVKLDG